MTAVPVDTSPATDQSPPGPVPARTAGPAADRSPISTRPVRSVRCWPLLVLAASAAAEVWSGWVGIAQKTGFGRVSPLPGIWPSLHLDTAITLPVGVEAYAAYALRAWLARDHSISGRTRRFAKRSAIFSFTLGMAGQIAYHLMAQAGMARAPWPVTMVVSCLPVIVLAMGTTLAHMLRADAQATDMPDRRTGPRSAPQSPSWSPEDSGGPGCKQPETDQDRSPSRDQDGAATGLRRGHGATGPGLRAAGPQADRARVIASRLAAAGTPVSRRTLRGAGATGSNQALNALARSINSEMAGAPPPYAPAG
jgi:hypothetical protein